MKSAIEESRVVSTVCWWWKIAGGDRQARLSAINWFHGAGYLYPDESVSEELLFLSDVLYERSMLP